MKLGIHGEALATTFLKKNGYKILEQNYKNPLGEIDIIARDRGTLVFIEVKTRKSDLYGMPFEAVTLRKQEKIKKIALLYLKKLRREVPIRFDVISIFVHRDKPTIDLIKDAFEF